MMKPGTYSGMLVACAMDTLENKKRTELLRVTFRITHESANSAWVQLPKAVERSVRMFMSDGAWPYTQRKLEALGFNGDFMHPDFSDEAKSKGIVLACEHQQSGGKTYENWELADWGGNREPTPPPDESLMRLSAKYKNDLAANTPPAGAPTSPPTPEPVAPPAASPPDDDGPPLPDESPVPEDDGIPI